MPLGLIRDEQTRRIVQSGWNSTCPKCAKASMFAGWLKLVAQCPACGLDYGFADVGAAHWFFALCVAAFPVVGFADWIEVQFSPDWWVHPLVLVPVLAMCWLVLLRPFKGWLVASQYFDETL